MFLKTIHINKYGKLSNYHLDLDKKTVICEKNGFGKSTICSFIKSMFYGLDTTRSDAFNERKHYYPFSGGNFGGYIVFDHEGKEYRIERTFDPKNAPKDKLTVFENGNETKKFAPDPGTSIFGFNRDNFERLILINSDKIEIKADSDINAKLNNYVENVGEDFDIDKALDKTDKYVKALVKDIAAVKKEIADDTKEIYTEEAVKKSLENKYIELNKLEKEDKKARSEFEKAALLSASNEKWKTYDRMMKEAKDKADETKRFGVMYPKGFPGEEKLEELKDIKEKLNVLSSELSKPEIAEDKKSEYESLKKRYGENIPDKNILDEIKNKTDEYSKIETEIHNYEIKGEDRREKELEYHFKDTDIDDVSLQNLENEVNHEKELEKELIDIPKKVQIKETVTLQEKKKTKKGLFIALIIVSLILAGAGVALISSVLPLGIALLALGIILLIFDMFIYFTTSVKNISTESEKTIEQDNPEYLSKNEELLNQKHKIENIFAKYRYEGTDYSVLLYKAVNDYKEYTSLLANKKLEADKYYRNKTEKEKIEGELNDFFAYYGLKNTPFDEGLDTIKAEVLTYVRLGKEISDAKEKRAEDTKKAEYYKTKYYSFYEEFGISEDKEIGDIISDMKISENLENEYLKKSKEAEEYFKNNSLDERPCEKDYDLDSLKQNSETKTKEYLLLKQIVESDEAKTENLDELKSKVSENNIKLKSLEEEAELYKALTEEIKAADQILKDRYIGPVREKFGYYASIIEETLGENMSMDKNYKISFDIEGGLRSSEHLSDGYFAMCALCFRLAILDNMFADGQPFIILDDPFSSLDKDHLKKASDLVTKLSSERQIIYFTCHESRII